MDKFVRLRTHKARTLDLSLFQFDPDLTFAVFFLNADKTIYGRYGSRSDFYDADREISLEGLAKAMQAALDLHANYPANTAMLSGKTGPKPRYKTLMDYPWAKQRQRHIGDCAHCHHVQNAEQMSFRLARTPIPDKVLFPWPMPDVIGLELDPKERATVQRVLPASAAEKAGFREDDEILTLQGQPILSIADVQWVMHNAQEPAMLTAEISRGGMKRNLTLSLAKGWRRKSDISWRVSSGMLRRLGLGQMKLQELPPAKRQKADLAKDKLALRVSRSVRRGSLAFEAGFRRDDIVVAFDGQSRRMSEGELLAHSLQNKMPGDRIIVRVMRAGKRIDLTLSVQ